MGSAQLQQSQMYTIANAFIYNMAFSVAPAFQKVWNSSMRRFRQQVFEFRRFHSSENKEETFCFTYGFLSIDFSSGSKSGCKMATTRCISVLSNVSLDASSVAPGELQVPGLVTGEWLGSSWFLMHAMLENR